MRSGGGGGYRAVQQQHVLGAEAAAAVRQAAGLARRRGHPQVTPLHVACAIMMSSSSSSSSAPGIATAGGLFLLRRAAFPLRHRQQQHDAAALRLRLRLDAALDRLPVRAPPLLQLCRHLAGGAPAPKTTTQVPLSNALVAALKRAQAAAAQHRRRSGNVVELERLAAAILDDPNVDRAVREASSERRPGSESGSITAACPEPSPRPNPVPAVVLVDRDGSSLALSLSCHHSGDQSSQTKQTTGRPAIVVSSELVTEAKASLPPWLRRTNQDQYHPNPTTAASRHRPKFTELTAENLKIMCHALEARVPPRHRDIVPGVASTVLRCRSGMMRWRLRAPASTTKTTWLLFRGKDWRGKKAMALELARLVFGSYTEFASGDSDPGLKIMSWRWPRENGACGRARLLEAILKNPHRVVFIDGIDDGLDHHKLENAIKNVITCCDGNGNGSGDGLEDVIVVLSSDGAPSSSPTSPPAKRRRGIGGSRGEDIREGSRRCFSLDLNAPAEDEDHVVVGGEEEEENLAEDGAGIRGVVDGVFQFD